MANVTKIQIHSGTYDIEDTTARTNLTTLKNEIETSINAFSRITPVNCTLTGTFRETKIKMHGTLTCVISTNLNAGSLIKIADVDTDGMIFEYGDEHVLAKSNASPFGVLIGIFNKTQKLLYLQNTTPNNYASGSSFQIYF